MKLSLVPASIPSHHPTPAPVSNPVPDPVSKPQLVLESEATAVPKYASPPKLDLNLQSVNKPCLEPAIIPSARTQKPSVDFTPPVDLATFFEQTPPVVIACPAAVTTQVESSGQMMVIPQEQSQPEPLFVPSTCQHLGSSDLLFPAESTAAMVPRLSLPSCAPPVDFQESVPVDHQASGAVQSGQVLPLLAGPLESVQLPTIDLQQPESDVMPPCGSQPPAALGLSPDILPQETTSLQAPVDSKPPAPESDLMTRHPVSETDLLNAGGWRTVLDVEEVSGSGDPNKPRAEEETTPEEVPSPCPAMMLHPCVIELLCNCV